MNTQTTVSDVRHDSINNHTPVSDTHHYRNTCHSVNETFYLPPTEYSRDSSSLLGGAGPTVMPVLLATVAVISAMNSTIY